GEGADEWLAGYPWFKVDKLLSYLDVIPGLRLSQAARRGFLWLTGSPCFSRACVRKVHAAVCVQHGWLDMYGAVTLYERLLCIAERWLPARVAWRRKAMFRAPFDSFFDAAGASVPPYVEQLLSEESLRRTGYFDVAAVQHWRERFRSLRAGSSQRTSVEM